MTASSSTPSPARCRPPNLEDLIGQLRAVDMEEVRAQIAAHEAEHGTEPHTH